MSSNFVPFTPPAPAPGCALIPPKTILRDHRLRQDRDILPRHLASGQPSRRGDCQQGAGVGFSRRDERAGSGDQPPCCRGPGDGRATPGEGRDSHARAVPRAWANCATFAVEPSWRHRSAPRCESGPFGRKPVMSRCKAHEGEGDLSMCPARSLSFTARVSGVLSESLPETSSPSARHGHRAAGAARRPSARVRSSRAGTGTIPRAAPRPRPVRCG